MNVVSLFSGVGGFDHGLERAGHTIVLQVENDPFCKRVLALRWPHVARLDDVRTIQASTIAEALARASDRCDQSVSGGLVVGQNREPSRDQSSGSVGSSTPASELEGSAGRAAAQADHGGQGEASGNEKTLSYSSGEDHGEADANRDGAGQGLSNVRTSREPLRSYRASGTGRSDDTRESPASLPSLSSGQVPRRSEAMCREEVKPKEVPRVDLIVGGFP